MSQDRSAQPAAPKDHEFFDVLGQLGSASADVVSAWTEAWNAMFANRGAPVGEAVMKSIAAPAAWPTALAPVLDEIQSAFKLPTFFDLPGRDLFKLPSLAPLIGLIQVSQEYATISVPIWVKAAERFLAEAKKRQEAGGRTPDSEELLDIWNKVLDLTMMEFNRSNEFARAQQSLLHAAAAQRREIGGAVERLAKTVDMPTRTEMTDVYRRLHDLTREVHSLRREIRALRQESKSAVPSRRKA